MRKRFKRRSRETSADINITAFMNLMVVLVPFLLITAVFSQLSVLELNLPKGDAAAKQSDEPKLAFEVVIRQKGLTVRERNRGVLKTFNATEKQYPFQELREYLVKVKGQFPDIEDITLLLEDDIPYDVLIQTMDAVRVNVAEVEGRLVQQELFPNISIGSAPKLANAQAAL